MCDSGKLDDSQKRRLLTGELLIDAVPFAGSLIPELRVWALFEAPPPRVWPLFDEAGRFKETMRGVKDSIELSRRSIDPPDDATSAEIVRLKVVVGLPFPLKDLTSITDGVHTAKKVERYQRRWQLVEGDYVDNSGSWTVVPLPRDPSRSLVHYRLHAEPKIRIPSKLKRLAAEKTIPPLFDQLRAIVRRGARP